MKAPGILTPEDAGIEFKGHPGQGLPRRGVKRCQCPLDVLESQSPLNVWVFGNIEGIVKSQEGVVETLPVRHNGDQDQAGAAPKRQDSIVFFSVALARCTHKSDGKVPRTVNPIKKALRRF